MHVLANCLLALLSIVPLHIVSADGTVSTLIRVPSPTPTLHLRSNEQVAAPATELDSNPTESHFTTIRSARSLRTRARPGDMPTRQGSFAKRTLFANLSEIFCCGFANKCCAARSIGPTEIKTNDIEMVDYPRPASSQPDLKPEPQPQPQVESHPQVKPQLQPQLTTEPVPLAQAFNTLTEDRAKAAQELESFSSFNSDEWTVPGLPQSGYVFPDIMYYAETDDLGSEGPSTDDFKPMLSGTFKPA